LEFLGGSSVEVAKAAFDTGESIQRFRRVPGYEPARVDRGGRRKIR
jgi:hypothetical protein